MEYGILAAAAGAGFGSYFLHQFLLKHRSSKRKARKTHHEDIDPELTQSDVSDGNSSSGYLTEAGKDVADLRRLAIPRLVDSPVHPHSKRVFDAFAQQFPENIFVVPLRLIIPLTTETFYLLSLNPQFTEPILGGHPQTVYNSLVYPLKMILQSKSIESFWFEALSLSMKDPMKVWQEPQYAEEHFKEDASIADTRYIIPLYLSVQRTKLMNPFYARDLLVNHFCNATNCLNESIEGATREDFINSTSDTTAATVDPVTVLILGLKLKHSDSAI